MRLHKSFPGSEHIPFKTIAILAGLLVLAIMASNAGLASASSETGPRPHPDSTRQQVDPPQLPSLRTLTVRAGGSDVALSPAFNPEVADYTATILAARGEVHAKTTGEARIFSYSVAGSVTSLQKPSDEAVIKFGNSGQSTTTDVILTVKTQDGSIARNYHVAVRRILRQEAIPAITIEADPSPYVAGLGKLEFTLNRDGDAADSLDVTIDLTQDQSWLSDTRQRATFATGSAETSFVIPAIRFSSSVTQSGNLTATVTPVTGYDVSGATATVQVISQPGPAVVVTFEHPEYAVDEDAGTLDLVLVARAHTSVPRVGAFAVTASSDGQTASSVLNAGDYLSLSLQPEFDASDFQMENGALVGRKTISVTLVDDDVYEGDEYFHIHLGRAPGLSREVALLDTEDEPCSSDCPNPYVVTIIDNEPEPINVGLANIRTGTLTKEDNGRDWFSFNAVAGEKYIIEVKHPLTFNMDSRNYLQVPGYLVDPSILEIVDSDDNQVLGEHDQGGFTLNWARAFFQPEDGGTYRIAVGAGAQDRWGLGSYTISVRLDDHADDFGTERGIALEVGESITGFIDSDVAPDDPDLEQWFWGGRGIEMLDDRDVFRFRIADAGEYLISLSEQPTGLGIRYVWDYQGNLWLEPNDAPVASFTGRYEPGTYYVEVGTPYDSEGNTGEYVLTLETAGNGN